MLAENRTMLVMRCCVKSEDCLHNQKDELPISILMHLAVCYYTKFNMQLKTDE